MLCCAVLCCAVLCCAVVLHLLLFVLVLYGLHEKHSNTAAAANSKRLATKQARRVSLSSPTSVDAGKSVMYGPGPVGLRWDCMVHGRAEGPEIGCTSFAELDTACDDSSAGRSGVFGV